ncbi:MAG: thioesterase family protein [Candidatus Omnitrophota bacterium]|nr:thioesterase family protein [Candidatus Omnitrophota bacterium]
MNNMDDFSIKRKIYYHHTDAGGVVYYGRYLDFFEEGRTEYLHKRGIIVPEYHKKGIMFIVVSIEVDYKRPARYSDEITIFTHIGKLGNASIEFLQEIKKEDTVLVTAKVVLACIGSDFKVKPLPIEIKQTLAR